MIDVRDIPPRAGWRGLAVRFADLAPPLMVFGPAGGFVWLAASWLGSLRPASARL